jgi:hypothetical protein
MAAATSSARSSLQNFVTVLRDGNSQIVQFQSQLCCPTYSTAADPASMTLTKLSSAIDDVQRFVAGSRNQTSEQVQQLANHPDARRPSRGPGEFLLSAPNAFANAYNSTTPTAVRSSAPSSTELREPVAVVVRLRCRHERHRPGPRNCARTIWACCG